MNTLTASISDNITLYYREGGSDKVYQCSIEPVGDDRYAVTFAYGRRGSALTPGTRTSHPVDHEEARSIFETLVAGKLAKGYTPGADGIPYGSNGDKRPSGYLPQLLNPIEEAELARLLRDDRHVAQEKFDGRRMLLRKENKQIDGINRKGLLIRVPERVAQSLRVIADSCVIDGENVGDRFHAFDLLNLAGEDLQAQPYGERLAALSQLLTPIQGIRLVKTAFTPREKFSLHAGLRTAGREGIVLKRLDAPYTAGRPASGGPALKHKFYSTLSAVVSAINSRRSVEVRLFGPEGWQRAGNVTIPSNQVIPRVGQVVEIRYLYAFRASGVLYQPVYLGVRSDVAQIDCRVDQLAYQTADDAEQAA